jgi:hypothetical protein
MRMLNSIKGKYAELLGLLQERYGHAKEQAEREINDWARRLKAYSAAELTELRDDVASLSASVGELVRRQAAVTTGLDQTLAASKLKLEEKANEAVDHIKGVVVRMSAVAALAVAAAIFALLALVTWFVALYTRLEPAYGEFQALICLYRGKTINIKHFSTLLIINSYRTSITTSFLVGIFARYQVKLVPDNTHC